MSRRERKREREKERERMREGKRAADDARQLPQKPKTTIKHKSYKFPQPKLPAKAFCFTSYLALPLTRSPCSPHYLFFCLPLTLCLLPPPILLAILIVPQNIFHFDCNFGSRPQRTVPPNAHCATPPPSPLLPPVSQLASGQKTLSSS